VKVCDKTCIFCFFPIINKYLCVTKRSLLSERPSRTREKERESVCVRACACVFMRACVRESARAHKIKIRAKGNWSRFWSANVCYFIN